MIGGLAGGFLALQLDDDPVAPAAMPTAAPTARATPDAAARLRTAIDRVLPAVVTVVADLPPVPQEEGGTLETRNFGSGIVVSGQGHVITNYHVIAGAADVTVILSTGEERPATVVADDAPFTDLAVLRVDPTGLRSAAFGDSDALELGQSVAAISSGVVTYENQVKVGVLSAHLASFPRDGVFLLDMLQTDAIVNNGDSGGALIDDSGLVVGMLTTVVRTSDGRPVEGISIAHSANSIRPIVDAVVQTGVNPRPRIGIERVNTQHVMLSPDLANAFDLDPDLLEALPVSDGALIVNVDPGSPAEEAGVLRGDVVVGVDGTAVNAITPFANLLASAVAGVELDLFVVRGDEQLVIPVVPQIVAGVPS
jgi:S1-C subfamily serine protease